MTISSPKFYPTEWCFFDFRSLKPRWHNLLSLMSSSTPSGSRANEVARVHEVMDTWFEGGDWLETNPVPSPICVVCLKSWTCNGAHRIWWGTDFYLPIHFLLDIVLKFKIWHAYVHVIFFRIARWAANYLFCYCLMMESGFPLGGVCKKKGLSQQ